MRRPRTIEPAPPQAPPAFRFWQPVLLVLLGVLILALYAPVRHHEFISLDDPDYVTENAHIQKGFTREGLAWAFSRLAGDATYWQPVTWLSHMLDCQWFGLRAGPAHLVNVFWHTLNSLLLLALLWQLTGARWRSFVVAALFALHPLQVDSVAWIAERKNVLSTFLWLLTLWLYARYARARGAFPQKPGLTPQRIFWYLAALGCFALGLMSKPMLVTLPCTLLLLDYWPLGRLFPPATAEPSAADPSPWKTAVRLVLEKIPFFALSLASSVITYLGHEQLHLIYTGERLPMLDRINNSMVSYATYLRKVFWPYDLTIHYEYQGHWPTSTLLLAAATVLLLSAVALGQARRRPALLVGWCWFLGTLVPTIGLVQAGTQAMADRYAYVPLIGWFVFLAWGVAELVGTRERFHRVLLGSLAAAAIAGCLAASTRQLRVWKNSRTLFEHAVRVAPKNVMAHLMLGNAIKDDPEATLRAYIGALKLRPDFAEGYYNVANLFAQLGQLDRAVEYYQAALQLKPGYPEFNHNMAVVLGMQGKHQESLRFYQTALEGKPQDVSLLQNYANALISLQQFPEASKLFLQAVQLAPDDPGLRYDFANALARHRHFPEAAAQFTAALRLRPDHPETRFYYGLALQAMNQPNEAAAQFREALRLRPDYAPARQQLEALAAPPARP